MPLIEDVEHMHHHQNRVEELIREKREIERQIEEDIKRHRSMYQHQHARIRRAMEQAGWPSVARFGRFTVIDAHLNGTHTLRVYSDREVVTFPEAHPDVLAFSGSPDGAA